MHSVCYAHNLEGLATGSRGIRAEKTEEPTESVSNLAVMALWNLISFFNARTHIQKLYSI